MMTTHRGFYDWGAERQSAGEQIRRAEIDLRMAANALQRATPGSTAYSIVQGRYNRARKRLEELNDDGA
jgi:hypothetical protein